jgi:hypothetical protein
MTPKRQVQNPSFPQILDPWAAKALSQRIGTALINGNWFIRTLRPLYGRAILMHGHRHIDWIGRCAGLPIISLPSPVMEVTDEMATAFYIHTLVIGDGGQFELLSPRAHRGRRRTCDRSLDSRTVSRLRP